METDCLRTRGSLKHHTQTLGSKGNSALIMITVNVTATEPCKHAASVLMGHWFLHAEHNNINNMESISVYRSPAINTEELQPLNLGNRLPPYTWVSEAISHAN